MSEPAFLQPERRSYLAPVAVAAIALALAIAIAIHFFPATSIDVQHLRTEVVDTHTVFQSQTRVIAPQESQDVLYIVETLKVDNKLTANIFLDDFSLTLTNPDGRQLTVKATQKHDLATVEASFPRLQPLLTTPLLRETSIDPGHVAQGSLVFALPVPKAMWDARQSAVVTVEIYNQPGWYLTIPKS